MDCKDAWLFLQGYLDNELESVTATALTEHLETCGDCQHRYQQLSALRSAIRKHAADCFPVPEGLRGRLLATLPAEEPVPLERRRWQPLKKVAGVAGWLLLGGVLGWMVHAWTAPQVTFTTALVNEAIVAHAVYVPEIRHPVEVDASQQQHLVAWLSKRLGAQIRAPQLSALGYELLGGRLLPADQGPAAQFMYQNASGRRLTLFIRKGAQNNRDTAFRFAQQDRIGAFYWVDQDVGYALVGEVDKRALAEIAQAVYQQLNP
jgi:anti-sigma factor RsiW